MEPIVLKEYSAQESFVLYEAGAYTELCSDVVVFRAMGGLFAGPSIDLIFLAVDYFELPNRFRGVRVSMPGDEQALAFARQYNENMSHRVYAVECNGKRFHVIAAKFWVLEYAAPLRISALAALNDQRNRDAFIKQHVKAWYKIITTDEF